MMRRTFAGLGLVVLIVAASACSSGGSDSSTSTPQTSAPTTTQAGTATPDELDGRSFRVQSLEGRELVAGTKLKFNFDGRTLSVVGGCNSLIAPFELLQDHLRWYKEPSTTTLDCSQAAMDQDAWLSDWLVAGVDATLDGTALTLEGDGITMVLADENSLNDPVPLVGTTWSLMVSRDGKDKTPLPPNVKTPTLDFSEDGTVAVFTGCNKGSGPYEADDPLTSLDFGPVSLTRMACGEEAASVESSVTAMVQGEVDAVIDGTTLTLTKDDQVLVYRAG